MTLKWNLVTKGMRPHAQLQSKLEQKIAKLETHLEHFPSDAVHLQVNLERHPKRVWFATALTLRLPSNILQSKKSGPDPCRCLTRPSRPCCARWRSSSPPCGARATGSGWRSRKL